MTPQSTNERLAEIEAVHGYLRPSITEGLEELLAAVGRVEIDTPSALFGSADGEVHAIWQLPAGRITTYVLGDCFRIEVVPHGPAEPFRATTAEAAAAYMRGVLTEF